MKLSRLTIIAALTATAACSGGAKEPSSSASLLPVDAAVTAMLPIGPYEVSITQTSDAANGPRSVSMSGYVDLGADPFGRDCALDLEIVEEVGISVSTFLVRRAASQEAYHQIVNDDSENNAAFERGVWVAATSPAFPAPVLFFAPNFLSEGVGIVDDAPGSYCTWRLLDRVATAGPNGQLTWDLEAASVLLEQGVRNFSSGAQVVAPAPSERLLGTLRVEKDSATGVITMWQSYDLTYEMGTKVVFTPTEARVVEPVVPS